MGGHTMREGLLVGRSLPTASIVRRGLGGCKRAFGASPAAFSPGSGQQRRKPVSVSLIRPVILSTIITLSVLIHDRTGLPR